MILIHGDQFHIHLELAVISQIQLSLIEHQPRLHIVGYRAINTQTNATWRKIVNSQLIRGAIAVFTVTEELTPIRRGDT
ncbi:hypothetical protein D3C77_731460 [compost metagenome]